MKNTFAVLGGLMLMVWFLISVAFTTSKPRPRLQKSRDDHRR